MNNDHCNKLLTAWYDEQCYESLHKLLHLIMGVAATVGAKRIDGRDDVDDVAQLTATKLWQRIEAGESIEWEITTTRTADNIARAILAEKNRIVKLKETLKETTPMEKPSTLAMATIRDIAETGLLPREWQVVHGIYWAGKTQGEISKTLSTSQQSVSLIHDKALNNMRQVLHRYGVYKDNCLAWYYGKAEVQHAG